MKKCAFLVLITAVVTYAQAPPSGKSKSDAENIASAMQAGPKFVTQNATVLARPSSPGGEYRVLRAGTKAWTFLPAIPPGTTAKPRSFAKLFLAPITPNSAAHPP